MSKGTSGIAEPFTQKAVESQCLSFIVHLALRPTLCLVCVEWRGPFPQAWLFKCSRDCRMTFFNWPFSFLESIQTMKFGGGKLSEQQDRASK